MAKHRWENDDEYHDDELFPDTEGDEDKELSSEYVKILDRREDAEIAKLYLIQKQLNYDVLRKTLAYLEKSWFWRCKSAKKKLNLVVETYQIFKTLVDVDNVSSEEIE